MRLDEILDLLGRPDRTDSLYLSIEKYKKKLHGWSGHTQTLVIKLAEDSTITWEDPSITENNFSVTAKKKAR